MASVLTTPYMFTQTHRVNTHLNMVKKKKKKKLKPNQNWSRIEEMKSKQPKITYMMGGKMVMQKESGQDYRDFCDLWIKLKSG